MADTRTDARGTDGPGGTAKETARRPLKRPSFDDYGDVLSGEEVAGLLGVSVETVRRWHTEGELPGKAVGRKLLVLKSRVIRWLEGEERRLEGEERRLEGEEPRLEGEEPRPQRFPPGGLTG